MAIASFFGKEAVLEAYDNRGIEVWSLFQNKDLMFAGSGRDELETALAMIEAGNGQPIYRLCVYSEDLQPEKITNKTENNGSFTFRVHGGIGGLQPGPGQTGAVARNADPILAKLQGVINEEVTAAIDRRLNGKNEEEEESWSALLMGYLREPQKIVPVIQAIGAMLKPGAAGTTAAPSYPGMMGNVNPPAVRATVLSADTNDFDNMTEEEKLQRLAAVLDRLEKADPDILNVLEKIATLAENDPVKYKMAKGFL